MSTMEGNGFGFDFGFGFFYYFILFLANQKGIGLNILLTSSAI